MRTRCSFWTRGSLAHSKRHAAMPNLELPTRMLPRVLLPTLAALGAILHPERADLVGITSETIGVFKFERILSQLLQDRNGRAMLRDRQRISEHSLLKARLCERGSLGHAYAKFMDSRQFEPSARPPVRFVQDKQSRYIAIRLREIHDILHVLYDCPTTLKGELTLKAIEFVQYGLPAHWASAYFAPSRLPLAERNFLTNQLFPWAIRTASKAPNLLSFDYESLFHTPIDQLRDDWKIERIPCSSA